MNKITLGMVPFFLIACVVTACSVRGSNATDKKEQSILKNWTDKKVKKVVSDATTSKPPVFRPKIRITEVLEAHNAVRYQHGLAPLTWSNDMAKISQKWANKLGRGHSCKMYHQTGNLPFGENLFISSPRVWSDGEVEIDSVSTKEVVDLWANEEKFYDYKQNKCQVGQQCGHYTQLVWKDTKEVGCSLKVCRDKSQVWVCNYFPAGNIVGARPY